MTNRCSELVKQIASEPWTLSVWLEKEKFWWTNVTKRSVSVLPFPRVCGFNKESVGLYEGRRWEGRIFLESFHSYQIWGLYLVIIVCLIRANPKSTHEEINNHKRKAYQWCTDKYLISAYPREKKMFLIVCIFCVFPWCKYTIVSFKQTAWSHWRWSEEEMGTLALSSWSKLAPTACWPLSCAKNSVKYFILSPLS